MARRRAGLSRSYTQVERSRQFDRLVTQLVVRRRPSRSVVVTVPLPRPLARRVRRVTYVYPRSRVQATRVVRVPLAPKARGFVLRRVLVLLPAVLPSAEPSYVSVDRGRLNIHSRRQQLRQLRRFELNRRRYQEHKDGRHKARNGQLESVSSDRFGIIAEAHRRGLSARRLADAALVSRALTGGR